MTRRSKHILIASGAILMTPLVLVLLAVVLAYCPPVQKWLVNTVGERMEEYVGLKVKVDDVRITPFLDLKAEGVLITDVEQDTILHAQSLLFDLQLRPLFKGRADVDVLQFDNTLVNTKSLISDCRIAGRTKKLRASAHGVEWGDGHARIPNVALDGADLQIVLTDTAATDTTSAPLDWVIDIDHCNIVRSHLALLLPPDTTGTAMRVDAQLPAAEASFVCLNLAQPSYAVKQLQWDSAELQLKNAFPSPLSRRDDETFFDVAFGATRLDSLCYDAEGRLVSRLSVKSLKERLYSQKFTSPPTSSDALAQQLQDNLASRLFTLQNIEGRVYLDSTRLEIPALSFSTQYSRVNTDLAMEWSALQSGDFGRMTIGIDGNVGRQDISDILQLASKEGYVEASLLKNEYLRPFLSCDAHVKAKVSGNVSRLTIEDYALSLLAPRRAAPIFAARGNMEIRDDFNQYGGKIFANLYGGTINGRFSTNLKNETYDVRANVHSFPVGRFVKGMQVSSLSGNVALKGRGYAPTGKHSFAQGDISVGRLSVAGYDLSGLVASASFHGGLADVDMALRNHLGSVKGQVAADLRYGYDFAGTLEMDDVNLHALFATPDSLSLHTVFSLQTSVSDNLKVINATGHIGENYLSSATRSVEMKDIDFALDATPGSVMGNVAAGDLALRIALDHGLDQIADIAESVTSTFMQQIEGKAIDQTALRHTLPTASLSLYARHDNPLHNYLRFQGTEMSALAIDLTTDSLQGINGHASVGSVKVGALELDTIHATLDHDEDGIKLRASIHNYRRENPNRFTVSLDASLLATGFSSTVCFLDEKGRKGIDLGVKAETADGTAYFTLFPQNPIIAYRTFTINDDNFVSINREGMIRTNIHLTADDGTGLIVGSEPTDETTNDYTISVYNFNLGELCNVLPYMPQFSGMVNGDFHVKDEHGDERRFSAMGTLEARDFAYEGTYIGDLGAEIIYLPKENGEHYADAFITYNNEEVGECSGVYYNADDHFSGDIHLARFPLNAVNAFLDGTDFMMRGEANGDFSLNGTLDRPVMNGTLNFEDAHFYSPVYGVDFRMDERPLVFAESQLTFRDYVLASGATQLKVNGNLDMTNLADVSMNFTLSARDFELINTRRQASSLIYGKVVSNFNGTARGSINNVIVRGQLDILPQTDATYLLTNSPLTIDDRLANLVTFVNFSDTTLLDAPQEAGGMFYDVNLGININDGAQFHCFLSANGNSYVDIEGGGNLVFRMTQRGDMQLTGRYTIQEGEMNYELPVIPLKKFQLVQGSYVEFAGDVMNPTLAIQAVEQTKAVVSDDDRQRSVNFNVGLDISRTLQDMGLAFTIDAPEDLAVQNQLATMSEEDRNKTAVALLATGMYVTENMTSGLKASNALNAFLQSEIQNIAGKALSTFDLSFGMENGTSNSGTLTTDYSFQFAKRFLDDRISIIIGGKVSTGDDVTNDASTFIDNVSLEYRLDNSATRYVKVFYDRDSHDPLEGTMMKTGAGLVLRRKTDRLGELFLFSNRRRERTQQ